jgi:hypothetical protein
MIKQNFKHFFSLRKLKLLFPRGHDCSSWKKSLSRSLEQLKLLLPPWEHDCSSGRSQLPQGTMNFPWENAPRNICSKFLCNHISFLFLYRSMTYRWKGTKGELQLCNWKHINQNSYAKVMIKQIFKHICSSSNMLAHWNNLISFSLGTRLFFKEKNFILVLKAT